MKKLSLIGPGLLMILFIFAGCNHITEPFDGPSLIDRFGEFQLLDSLSANRTTVDFANGETVAFSARFNKKIEWVLRITGQSSGAVKEIISFDNLLNADNARWNGSTTLLPLFRAENCLVELIIPEEDSLTMTVMVEALSPRTYPGSVFIDFETDPGANMLKVNPEFELTARSGIQNDIPAGQGENYLLLEGTDNVVPNYFVGLFEIYASYSGQTYIPLPVQAPEDLYFNAFVYHDGRPHTIAVIQFATDTNGDGLFTDGIDQTFQIAGDYPLNWKGWRQISHPMSDLGITDVQMSKLVAIRVLLISNLNAQPNPPLQVLLGIDNLTFTVDKALEL